MTTEDQPSITGVFDTLFEEESSKSLVPWKVLKVISFRESGLQPYVDGGLFRIPERVYYEFDGIDMYDPQDNVRTMIRIMNHIFTFFSLLPIEDRVEASILAYITRNFQTNSPLYTISCLTDAANMCQNTSIFEAKKMHYLSKVVV